VLLAAIPLRTRGSERRIPTLFTNSFVRNLALASLGFAVLSWGHAELDRKRLLEPLPISEHLQDVARAILPPFLPEEVERDWDLDMTLDEAVPIMELPIEQLTNIEDDDDEAKRLPKKLRRHLQYLYRSTPKPQSLPLTVKQWRLRRRERKALSDRAKRFEIYDQLVALQTLKKRVITRKKQNGRNRSKQEESSNPLGYALITGASRGIGRALAVELARWEIPLILVARDEERLVRLATDLERCYGVKCCVLPADLSKPGAAEKVYKATTAAGLQVEVLVNNAGLSSSGEFVDMEETNLQHILQVNAMAVASLSHLYGSDMKKRRRGRILIVSSIVGVSYAGPTVAAYAATKAFEKVLGLSMAKELEVYGVGVTCLLPGAVGDSSFRKSSGSADAVCWRIPFYVKSCESVADQGVRALLLGDLEVIPGWQNRAFAKILLPILPQRGITLITEMAWNPLSHMKPNLRRNARRRSDKEEGVTEDVKEPMPRFTWPGNVQRMPPVVIKIPDAQMEAPNDGDNDNDQSLKDSSGEQVSAPVAHPETDVWILEATDQEEEVDDTSTAQSQIQDHDEDLSTSSDATPPIGEKSVDDISEPALPLEP
jgi:short-subunit dehydrogenase